MRQIRRFKFAFIFIPILLNLILYTQGLSGDFVWDDRSLVLQNSLVQDLGKILENFKYTLTIFDENYGYYRPLSVMSFALDYTVWQKNAFGYHLTNLLLHILVVVCIIYLCYQLFSYAQAILISIVYTVFAAHIENVVFISGRMDILATLFILLALVLYFSTRKIPSILRMFLCYILSLMALLSKEVAFILPLIFVLIVLTKIPPAQRKMHFLRGSLFIGGAFITYMIMRTILLGSPFPAPSVGNIPFLIRMINIPRIILFYIQILLFPYNLNARHYEFVLSDRQFGNLIFSAVVLAIIIFIVFRVKKELPIRFGFFWFLIGLIPVMNILPLSGIPVSERFLYFPSIGIAIVAGGLVPINNIIFKTSNIKISIIEIILFLVIINNIIFTFLRIPVWKNEEIFFMVMAKQNPESPLAHHNLGHYYYRQGNWYRAEMEFKKAISINPFFPAPHASLGDLYTRTGRYKEAIVEYSNYLHLFPNAPNRSATLSRITKLQNLLKNTKEK